MALLMRCNGREPSPESVSYGLLYVGAARLRAGAHAGLRSDTLTVGVVAPAGDGAVGLESARVSVTGADLSEMACRRGALAMGVVAPAGNGTIGLEPAGVIPARADLGELACW